MGKVLLVMLSMLALSAQAATYRWVDADGRVTYGDRPPANGTAQMQNAATAADATAPAGFGALPYALRSVANRFPVRLYTSRGCEVCEAARAHLIQRGVPFTESILASDRDLTVFRRIGFTDFKVPSLSVGRERAQGFGADNWNALLDAAGYPEKSMLPAGWRPPEAAALAPAAQSAPAAATADATPGRRRARAPLRDTGRHPSRSAAPRPALGRGVCRNDLGELDPFLSGSHDGYNPGLPHGQATPGRGRRRSTRGRQTLGSPGSR